ncbi:MAG: PEP-CTERM sorting domain-containing protein [Burkholderiales bacterium]
MSPPRRAAPPARSFLRPVPAALRRTRLLAALALALPALDATAVTLFWDPNFILAGTGGTGTWNTTTRNWAPADTGIRLQGNGLSTGVGWPNTTDDDAIFGGTGGTVALDGTLRARSVKFRTNGYTLTGGTLFLDWSNITDGSGVDVAAGVTATIDTRLDSALFPAQRPFRALTVSGDGTLVLGDQTAFPGIVRVLSGTLRPKSATTLEAAAIQLMSGQARVDFGAFDHLRVGSLLTSSGFDLGNHQLTLTGLGEIGQDAVIAGAVTGNASSGIVVGANAPVTAQLGSTARARSTMTLGFLHLNAGNSFIENADVTLTQTGSTGFGGHSSLFLEVGTSLTVRGGSILTLSGTPQLHNDAVLDISQGSKLSVARSTATPDAPASLRVGFAGGTSKLLVSGDGTVVESADLLHIGNDSFTPSPGVGEVGVGAGGIVRAPILSFGSTASSLTVSEGGLAQFDRFDSRDSFNRAGTLRIESGAVRIGNGPQSALVTGASTFNGKLTGGSGLFIKQGAGETALTSNDSDFAGTVRILEGKLTVAPGALKNTLLSMVPGGTLAAPLATLDTPLQIGALGGTVDLDLANMTARFGGGDHSAVWGGRFTAGNVILSRVSGSGIQTFLGGTSDAPFTAPSLSTSGGTFRLQSGVFAFTNATNAVTARTSLFAEGTGRIEIDGGARVTAGSGVRIHNGGRIVASGDGTRLDITAAPGGTNRVAFVGSFGGGALEVTQGAVSTASHLVLGNASEPNATSTVVVANGGRLELATLLQLEGAKANLTVDRATVTIGHIFVRSPDSFAGVIRLSDPVVPAGGNRLTAPTALTLTPFAGTDFAPSLTLMDGASGPGSLAFVGSNFTQTLGGTLSYTGRTIVEGTGAQVHITAPLASRDVIARNGGLLDLKNAGAWDTSRTTFRTESNGQIAFSGANLTGGTLRGTGFSASHGSFDGTSLAINSRLTAGPGVNWSNAVLQGTLETFHATGLDNVTVSTSGSVIVHLAASFSDVENNGLLDLRGGAGGQVFGALASGGGSRILIGTGATLGGDTISLNGALLKNNGTVTAPLVINYLGTAKGAGSFGSVTVNDGGTFSPGNSPGVAHTGSVTFNEGGHYEVEVADALGAPGTGFDLWDIAGNLDFNAGVTANRQFVVSLISLNAGNAPGPASNFDKRHGFAWTVLRADSVSGFDENELRLDTSGFANDHDGRFALALTSVDGRSELQIVYQPVPEPATRALLVGGVAALLAWRRRQRRA